MVASEHVALTSQESVRDFVGNGPSSHPTPSTEKELLDVLFHRCNNPETITKASLSSMEGQLADNGDHELALIQVITRHGERAPFGGIPLVNPMSFHCPGMDRYFLWPQNQQVDICPSTVLTSNGCKQHELLGRHFRATYRFVPRQLEQQLFVLSTDRQRTIQSARCFIVGLLGNVHYNHIHKSQTMFEHTPLGNDGFISICPLLDRFQNELRMRPDFLESKRKWDETKVKANSFLSVMENASRHFYGVLEFYEGLVCHFCHLHARGLLESITPCKGNLCFPPHLALEVVKAADLETRWLFDEKVSI